MSDIPKGLCLGSRMTITLPAADNLWMKLPLVAMTLKGFRAMRLTSIYTHNTLKHTTGVLKLASARCQPPSGL